MKFKLKLQHFHTSQWTRTRQSLSTFGSRDICVPFKDLYYKSAFYSYNFHIFRLFGFGKEKVDVYRFMSKQFIALFAGLLVLCSIQFISPQKCVVLFWEEKGSNGFSSTQLVKQKRQ